MKKSISIKSILIFIAVVSMLLIIGITTSLIFRSWFLSSEQITKNMAGTISRSLYNRVFDFIRLPYRINEANHRILENGILNIADENKRDKFFAGILSSCDESIYSFSYGTETGEYYGARRNEAGKIEIMRNNETTGGNSWYYSVTEDLGAGDLVVQAGKFDPRTRAWYKAAKDLAGPSMSPIYKHFVMDDLTISAAWPVYDGKGSLEGVMGTHILLSGIGLYLAEITQDYGGYALIVEKDTGFLITNSQGIDNFTVDSAGNFNRLFIEDSGNAEMKNAYQNYIDGKDPEYKYKGEKDSYYVNVRELHIEGLDWVLITALPSGIFMRNVYASIRGASYIVVLFLILALGFYNIITRKLMDPMDNLLEVSASLAEGDLAKRVRIKRQDEIGLISSGLNKVADKMQFLINNLEITVLERTKELNNANMFLEENRKRLQLILDSTAESIYGFDLDGNCMFCNLSCIITLGYQDQDDLLGKDMHNLVHHSYEDGTAFLPEDCGIMEAIKKGIGFSADNEVFWRADGTFFYVEYRAYPQIMDDKVVGGVITFLDITQRKQREDEIKYLSCHDVLTGLFNRSCFEENRKVVDIVSNLPLSIIFADINGLKMTNDIFGHSAGDKLIKKSAEIIKKECDKNDIIARVGGDEFIILLPKTDKKEALKKLDRIKKGFENERIEAIKCSISLGLDVKNTQEQSFEDIMANAENEMYKQKTMNRQSINNDMINTIIDTLHKRSHREKQHSEIVGQLCARAGQALMLNEADVSKMERAGYLHDIGKIIIDESILNSEKLTDEEYEKMKQHSIVGYRILNLFDGTLDLAEYVYSHHERWDGKGYPRGLKEEEIPLISRIISVIETYERVLNQNAQPYDLRIKRACDAIKEGSGKQFDPEVADLFVRLIEKECTVDKN